MVKAALVFCSQVRSSLTYWGVSFVTTEGLCTLTTNHSSPLFVWHKQAYFRLWSSQKMAGKKLNWFLRQI